MLESPLLREQIYDGYDMFDDDKHAAPSAAAASSSEAPVNLVASHSRVYFSEDFPLRPDEWSWPEFDAEH